MSDEEDQIFGETPLPGLAYCFRVTAKKCATCLKPIELMQAVWGYAETTDGSDWCIHHYSCAWDGAHAPLITQDPVFDDLDVTNFR